MALEDIGAVEALLRRGAGAGAETAHHGAFVMCESVPVLIIFACKALGMVLAGLNWALLWALGEMGEEMGLEVLEDLAAIRVRADSPLAGILV